MVLPALHESFRNRKPTCLLPACASKLLTCEPPLEADLNSGIRQYAEVVRTTCTKHACT